MTAATGSITRRLLYRLISVALLIGSSQALAETCAISVRWNDDPPYSFQGPNQQIQGIHPDILREALQRMDCTVTFIELPWARGLKKLEAGTLDILPGALQTAERQQFAYFSRPINRSPNVLFVNQSSLSKFPFTQLSELKNSNFRLGAQINVTYGGDYAALLQDPDFAQRLVLINNRRSAWRMIKADRLDGLIADEITGLLELQQLGLSGQVVKSGLIVSGEPAAYALSKKTVDAEFVQRLDQTLNAMLEDGSYLRIMQGYLPCPVSVEQLGCQ